MDYAVIAVLIIIFISLINYILRMPSMKIKRFEFYLKKNLPHKQQFIIRNYSFYDGSMSYHIPYLIINQQGIHLIYIYTYLGKIFGRELDTHWILTQNQGKRKTKFENPLLAMNSIKESLIHTIPVKTNVSTHLVCICLKRPYIASSKPIITSPFQLLKAIGYHQQSPLLKPLEIRKLHEMMKNLKNQPQDFDSFYANNYQPQKSNIKKSYYKDK